MPLPDEIPEWAQSCPSRKQKFASADDARRAFRTEKRRGTKGYFHGTPHVYRCMECDGFHMTSTARQRDGKKHGNWKKGREGGQ